MLKKSKVELELLSLQKTTRILIFVVVILIVLVGVLLTKDYFSSQKSDTSKPKPIVQKQEFPLLENYPKIEKGDHLRGNPKAKYLLIEFSDLECPYCKQFHSTMQAFLLEYGKDAAWVYRHFPLDQLHSKARDEAIAAECVAKLGGNDAFWQYIDKIFETTPSNDGLDLSLLPQYAAEVGLDSTAFNSCYQNKETASVVENQYRSGLNFGVEGTPGSFLINTKNKKAVKISGALPLEKLKQAVSEIQ